MPHQYSEDEKTAFFDKLAVQEVLDRYFFGEGRFDVETILSCFTPDAAFGDVVGHDAIRAIMEGVHYFQECYVIRGSQKITIDGDNAYADIQAVGFVLRTDGGADTPRGRVMVQGVRYNDHLIRTSDGWKIKTRFGFKEAESGHDTTWQFDAASVPIHLD
jgi:hypothetical protein